MSYEYTLGFEQPAEGMPHAKERRVGGFAIGVLRMDAVIPFLPGDVSNASTFNFPMLYKVVKGVSRKEVIYNPDPNVVDKLIKAGRELEEQGVRAITTSCGYFANFQKEVAAGLDVPVFLSSLLQLPIIKCALKPHQKVGIICADSECLTPKLFSSIGVDDLSIIRVAGFQNFSMKWSLGVDTFNSQKFEEELVNLATHFVNDNPDIGALLFECSNLPPYAWSVQKAVKLPVFDFTTLINWIFSAVVRRPFAGFI